MPFATLFAGCGKNIGVAEVSWAMYGVEVDVEADNDGACAGPIAFLEGFDVSSLYTDTNTSYKVYEFGGPSSSSGSLLSTPSGVDFSFSQVNEATVAGGTTVRTDPALHRTQIQVARGMYYGMIQSGAYNTGSGFQVIVWQAGVCGAPASCGVIEMGIPQNMPSLSDYPGQGPTQTLFFTLGTGGSGHFLDGQSNPPWRPYANLAAALAGFWADPTLGNGQTPQYGPDYDADFVLYPANQDPFSGASENP